MSTQSNAAGELPVTPSPSSSPSPSPSPREKLLELFAMYSKKKKSKPKPRVSKIQGYKAGKNWKQKKQPRSSGTTPSALKERLVCAGAL